MTLAAFADVSDAARLALHVAVAPWLPWRAERQLTHAITTLAPVGDLHARVAANMAAFLPERPAAEIARLTGANIDRRWTDRELVWLWRMAWSTRRRRTLTRNVEIRGLEHLRASRARGRGAILLEAHLGRRVLAREAIRHAGVDLCQVHNERHGGELTRLGQVLRRLHRFLLRRSAVDVVEIIPDSLAYLRALTTRLARNDVLMIPGLGVVGGKFVAVDALGTTLAVPTGTLSLARTTGASLLPLVAFEDATGRDHVVIEAALPAPTAGDAGLAACASAYGAVLDTWVRRHPEQWFWWFRPPAAVATPADTRKLAAGQVAGG